MNTPQTTNTIANSLTAGPDYELAADTERDPLTGEILLPELADTKPTTWGRGNLAGFDLLINSIPGLHHNDIAGFCPVDSLDGLIKDAAKLLAADQKLNGDDRTGAAQGVIEAICLLAAHSIKTGAAPAILREARDQLQTVIERNEKEEAARLKARAIALRRAKKGMTSD